MLVKPALSIFEYGTCEMSVIASGVKIRQERSFDFNDESRDVIQDMAAVYNRLTNSDNDFRSIQGAINWESWYG